MKTISVSIRLAFLAILALLALGIWRQQAPTPAQAAPIAPAAPVAQAAQATATCASGRSVQVSGAAVITVTPDRALIQLGVQSNGTSADLVRAANQQQIQRVIAAVRALGVDAKDIATDYYIVYPVYDDYSSLVIKGYRIDNTVSITLRDITLADDVILAAIKAGANEVQDVQFYTSELRKYRDLARELAMKAAGEKAQALASAAGSGAGCVLSISENTWTQYYGSWRGGRATTMWAQNVIQNANSGEGSAGSPEDDSPISLGQIAVRAEVSASYSLN
jgi:uncharacterized protein